jgi:four helix bundle protein
VTGDGRFPGYLWIVTNFIDMKFKFEKLLIWQDAMKFGEEINVFTESFPPKELYNLSSQIRRAADSVALNISEGSIGQSNPEQHKFIGYSIRSLAEVVTCLHKAKMRNYISENDFANKYEFSFKLMNMLIAFNRNIK